jgi:hypothetical protein
MSVMMFRTAWSTMLPTIGSSQPARTKKAAVASDKRVIQRRRGGQCMTHFQRIVTLVNRGDRTDEIGFIEALAA